MRGDAAKGVCCLRMMVVRGLFYGWFPLHVFTLRSPLCCAFTPVLRSALWSALCGRDARCATSREAHDVEAARISRLADGAALARGRRHVQHLFLDAPFFPKTPSGAPRDPCESRFTQVAYAHNGV